MTQHTIQEFNKTDDTVFENTLRPKKLEDFVGQQKVKDRLHVMMESARMRGEALDHVLLSGPPGLGKTTLAQIMGQTMGVAVRTTSGPVIEKAGDLAGLLTSLEQGDILFIDEIHRLNKNLEEYLYPAMEDFRIDILIDQGPNARSVTLNLPKFTLIGATTRAGMISAPLRSRFNLTNRLDYYSADDLRKIVLRSSTLLNLSMPDTAALEIAKRSRGTPRIANNLLKWVRDYAMVHENNVLSAHVADKALNMLEIDAHGLDEMDKTILQTLITKFQGGPVGIHSLATAVGEEADTLEEVHEPFLIMEGYIQRTQQGRVALPLAYKRLGITPSPSNRQSNLL